MNTENESQAIPETLQEAQVRLVRDSLIKETFNKYNELVSTLKKLPIHQQSEAIRHAYLSIDDGMLWIKELLNTSPLMFSAPAPGVTSPEAIAEENEIAEVA